MISVRLKLLGSRVRRNILHSTGSNGKWEGTLLGKSPLYVVPNLDIFYTPISSIHGPIHRRRWSPVPGASKALNLSLFLIVPPVSSFRLDHQGTHIEALWYIPSLRSPSPRHEDHYLSHIANRICFLSPGRCHHAVLALGSQLIP